MIPVSRWTAIGPSPRRVAVLALRDSRDVADQPDVERDRRVPVVVAGERLGAVQAVLLLHRRREPQLAVQLFLADGVQQRVHRREADAVVHARPDEQPPDLAHPAGEDHRRAGVQAQRDDRRAVAQAELDPEVVVADAVLFALLGGEDVPARRCEQPLDPAPVRGQNADGLPDHVAALRAVAAIALGAVEQEEALVGDVPDDVADLVHVRLDEDPRTSAADTCDDVADPVTADLRAARRPAVLQQVGELGLGAGGRGHRAQLGQEGGQVHAADPTRVSAG